MARKEVTFEPDKDQPLPLPLSDTRVVVVETLVALVVESPGGFDSAPFGSKTDESSSPFGGPGIIRRPTATTALAVAPATPLLAATIAPPAPDSADSTRPSCAGDLRPALCKSSDAM
jgi:hypothetical protein